MKKSSNGGKQNTLKIMRATMLLSATSNGVGVNVRLVGYGLSISIYQGIYNLFRVSIRVMCAWILDLAGFLK